MNSHTKSGDKALAAAALRCDVTQLASRRIELMKAIWHSTQHTVGPQKVLMTLFSLIAGAVVGGFRVLMGDPGYQQTEPREALEA